MAMFGTVATIRPKPGQEQAVVEAMEKWGRERKPKIKGFVASYLYRKVNDRSELILTVVFDSKENYVANANDPEQDRWYRELRALLESDPTWMDGEVLQSSKA